MDPLSEVLSLLKLRSHVSGGFDAGGDWAVQFGPHDGIKFHAVITGECWLSVEGEPGPITVGAGECFLLARGKPFRLASDPALEPVDVQAILPPVFDGRIVTETRVGDHPAVIPAIRGSAWITGIAQVFVDPTDPFPEGYLLTDTWPGDDVQ